MIAGIGYVVGERALVVVATTAGIDAGAIQHMGREKLLRAQNIALENCLPFVHLVESAGANLLKYRVEQFIHGGGIFYNLARLSAAGCPVIAVVHGSSTAGGAYMPGLSDYVIMVRGRATRLPRRAAAAQGRHRRDRHRRGARRRGHAHARLGTRRIPGRRRRRRGPPRARSARPAEFRLATEARRRPPPALRPPTTCSASCRPTTASRSTCARSIARICRRLRLARLQARLRRGHRLRPCRDRGAPRRHRHQQRPARPRGRDQGDALHPGLLPGGAAARLPAEHDRLHRRQGLRGGRHDQARLEDDPGGLQRGRAADHAHVRRVLRRRQLRHVRARLQPALPVFLAERADRGDGRRAGRDHDGDRHAKAA